MSEQLLAAPAGAGLKAETRPTAPMISERDLILYIRSRVLRRLTIVETVEGLYRLHVDLTVEPRELVLSSARGQPREWSSLDSLARQIRGKFGAPTCVTLAFGTPATKSGAEGSAP